MAVLGCLFYQLRGIAVTNAQDAKIANDGRALERLITHERCGGTVLGFLPRQLIYDAGNRSDFVYYVHSGEVRVYFTQPDGSAMMVEILGPGDWFGVSSLAGGLVHQTRAMAETETKLTRTNAEKLLDMAVSEAGLLVELVRSIARREAQLRVTTAELVFDDSRHRLVSALIRFSDSPAATMTGGEVTLRITQQELAEAVGVARETVSLALTELRKQNLVATSRNRLTFDPKVLEGFRKGRPKEEQPLA